MKTDVVEEDRAELAAGVVLEGSVDVAEILLERRPERFHGGVVETVPDRAAAMAGSCAVHEPIGHDALWIAAGASPREIADRAGHSSVVTVLDRYGHLLPGAESKVNDALDRMAASH